MKRPFPGPSGPGSDARQSKVSKYTKYGPHVFKALCPEVLVDRMMGKKGAYVHQTESRTNTHLQFSRRDTYFPGTQYRILAVFARQPGDIMLALEEVMSCIAECAKDERPPRERGVLGNFVDSQNRTVFRCAVSKAAAGGIIGTRGERIRQLRESTGAVVDVEREVVDNHQLIAVAGDRDQVLSVLDSLNATVQHDATQTWFQEWAEHQELAADAAPAGHASSLPPRDTRPPPRVGSDPAGGSRRSTSTAKLPALTDSGSAYLIFVGKLAQGVTDTDLRAHFSGFGKIVEAEVKMDHETGRSKGFGFVRFGRPEEVADCLANKDHRINGEWVDVKPYQQSAQEAHQQPSQALAVEVYRDRRHDDRTNGSHSRQDVGSHNHQTDAATLLRTFEDIARDVPEEHSNAHYCICLYLENAKCGALIGRGGENVTAVERQTGAKVKFKDKEAKREDTLREVTIEGPLYCIYAAHLILMKKYNEIGDQEALHDDPPARGEGHRSRGPGKGGGKAKSTR
mmetsp:Transcript_46721/g.108960  ORF Transcript_46721/g.108960 Transcript_46721/m.108960 type:complete len:512 (+) Transcript_46721:63-1598(+)